MARIRKSIYIDGRRYWATGTDEVEVQLKLREIERDVRRGTFTQPVGITVEKWTGEWLDTYKSQTCNETTLKNLRSMISTSLYPHLGMLQIQSIKPVHLQRFLLALAEEGKSQSYIIKMKNSLEGIFGTAQDNGIIAASPATRITMPNVKSGHRRALTQRERAAFLAACDKCGMAGLWGKVLYYTGMRPAESAEIRGEDILIDDGVRYLHVKGTKTEKADRYVPLPAELELPNLKKKELLLHTKAGEPLTKSAMRRAWQRLTRQMNIEMGCKTFRGAVVDPVVKDDLVPYCLRHNYATMLQEAGVDIGVASAMLGHASTATTSRVYTHHNLQSVKSAYLSLNAYLSTSSLVTVSPSCHQNVTKREQRGTIIS